MKDKAYLDWIHQQACVVTGSRRTEYTDIVAHHVRWGAGAGLGQKPSDYWCLPLSPNEHVELHNMGEKRYWKKKGIDPHQRICMLLCIYVAHAIGNAKDDYIANVKRLEALLMEIQDGSTGN